VACNDRFNVFTFPVDERPLTVTFDPDEWVLKGLEFEKPTQMWLYDLRHGRTGERIRAARALARSVDPRVVPALQGAVLHDPFWGVQGEAALALGRIGTEQALQALLQCTDIPNPRARRMVMQALGEFRDERAAEALIAKLEKDVSYFVEAEAARSLGKTRSKRAFERLSAALAKESFQEVIRVGVFDGFMHLGDKAAIPLCKEWSSYGRPREARAAAVRCLGKLGEGSLEVVEYLSGLLKDYHVTVRMAAAEALKTLRDERALPHLEAQLNRELDGRVRRRIREAIEAIKEGSRAQLEQLREEVEKIREENRRLKSALARIEAQLSARQGQT
jgi:aminopeptidase N